MAKKFDDTRIERISDECVQCGQCLPHCPTYRLHGHEAQSPRGRLDLLRLVDMTGAAAPRAALDAIEDCLACGQCERYCPLHLPVVAAISAHRAQRPTRPSLIERSLRRPYWMAMIAAFARGAPEWLLARLPQAPMLRALQRSTRALGVLPRATTAATLRILPGCTGKALDGDTIAAFCRLATHLGASPELLHSGCCGSLAWHRGHHDDAHRMATRLQADLLRSPHLPAVHFNTGCHNQLARISKGAPPSDALVWLAERRSAIRWRPVPTRQHIAVHWPCTSSPAHRRAVKDLLTSLPGVTVRELTHHTGCCGAAGDQTERTPDRAAALFASWRQDWAAGCEPLILSSNIGCRVQIAADLSISATIMHPLVFLADQLDTP